MNGSKDSINGIVEFLNKDCLNPDVGKNHDWVFIIRTGPVFVRQCQKKQEYRILNHILCGHSLLNDHRARIMPAKF